MTRQETQDLLIRFVRTVTPRPDGSVIGELRADRACAALALYMDCGDYNNLWDDPEWADYDEEATIEDFLDFTKRDDVQHDLDAVTAYQLAEIRAVAGN